jgi:SAM-dependent methyltransferase
MMTGSLGLTGEDEMKLPYDPEGWEKNAPEYAKQILDRPESPYNTIIFDSIAEMYEPGMKVLEVGCAGGHDYRYLSQRKLIDDYTGLDITEGYIELARQTFPMVKWVQGDARNLPFEYKQFDITFNLLMLLHLDKEGAQKALSEMCRVTKKAVFIYTYTSPIRYDCWTKVKETRFLFNVLAREELDIPGWEAERLTEKPTPHLAVLRYMPIDMVIHSEYVLRRKG